MNALASMGVQGCKGSADWLFCFEYFSIAKTMPLALKGYKPSAETKRTFEIVKIIGVAVNTIVSVAIGIVLFFAVES